MTQVVLTISGNWTVPPDWNSAVNTIEGLGPGGKGGFVTGDNGTPGGGSAYARIANLVLTIGASIPYVVGVGGSETQTQFRDNTTLVADFGRNGSTFAGDSSGGRALNSVGTTKYDGGGANWNGIGLTSATSGGGGAAGPSGAGASGIGPSSNVPGNGGRANNGVGGLGGVWAGSPANGSTGSEWGAYGTGGGGSGGAAGVLSGKAGNGGSYGGGAGAPALGYAGPLPTGGAGLIIITYTSKPVTPTISVGTVTTTTPCGGAVSAQIQWSATNGASYNVYRSATSGSGYTLIGNTAGTSYTDNPPSFLTTYYYVVTTVLNGYESAISNQVSVAGITGITPDVTTGAITWF